VENTSKPARLVLIDRKVLIFCKSMVESRFHLASSQGEKAMSEPRHLDFLQRCIELAEEAVQDGNHPFAAVLVSASGDVLLEAKNSHSIDGGPGHAESNLARLAARQFDIPTLRGSTLYTSVEPCTMCSGTIYWAEIGAVVFGMTERRLGELTGDDPDNPTQDLECRTIFAAGQRKIRVTGPFPALDEQISAQHKEFWTPSAA